MSRITLPIAGVQHTYLCLKKQRFMCKACDSSFTAHTPIVEENCYISEHTKAQVVIKAAEAQSLTSILDILEQRDSRTIKNHFIANYSLSDRKKVETVTIDMSAGYVNVIKEMFPQTKIIIDRFHLVQVI